MACASRIAEMVAGIDVAAAQNLTREELVESLGGLPEASTHAGYLAIDALRAALSRLAIC
jgi:NifU-like protein involved in Fe-S cluster formation